MFDKCVLELDAFCIHSLRCSSFFRFGLLFWGESDFSEEAYSHIEQSKKDLSGV